MNPSWIMLRAPPSVFPCKISYESSSRNELEIPALIGGKALYTGDLEEIRPPHELSHRLGVVHKCGAKEAQQVY